MTGAFGFGWPLGLAALSAILLLFWIAARSRRRRDVDVPSLLLWESIPPERSRGRFRIDWLLALQACLLAALAIWMAEPYWNRPAASDGAVRVLVVDASASMQTLEAGETRFQAAVAAARALVSAAPRGTHFALIRAGLRPEVVIGPTRDAIGVRRALTALEVSDAPARISLALQRAQVVSGPRGSVTVLTDLPRAAVGAAGGLQWLRFGDSDDNVSITSLRIDRNPFEAGTSAVGFAVVRNHSAVPRSVGLESTVAGRDLPPQSLQLGARESKIVALRDLGDEGRLDLRLVGSDALSIDDRAAAFLRPPRALRVVAVTRSEALAAELGALMAAVPTYELSVVAPELAAEALAAADVALLHDWLPPGPLPERSLVVFPPAGQERFPVAATVDGARILDWNDAHPLLAELRYLDPLQLGAARVMRAPVWARSLITARAEGRDLSLAFAGEREGTRVVCFAFDLAGRSLRDSEQLSLVLLLLNSLRWLDEGAGAGPRAVIAGAVHRAEFATATPIAVRRPDGSREARSAALVHEVAIDRVGEWRIESAGGTRVLYANASDAEESDVGRGAAAAPSTEVEEARERVVTAPAWTRVDLTRWFAYAALALLLLEWLTWAALRRREAEGGGVDAS